MEALDTPETTVAAPQTSFLRASVNAVRGALSSVHTAVKVGNATARTFEDTSCDDTYLLRFWRVETPGETAGGGSGTNAERLGSHRGEQF